MKAMKEIILSNGMIAIVDDEDFEELNKYKWHYSIGSSQRKGYARRMKMTDRKTRRIYMHRVIMGLDGNPDRTFMVDHIDRNPLNNSKENLRICTLGENLRNKSKKINGQFRYMGIRKARKLFAAQITHNGNHICLGTYQTQEEAALAYNKKKIELHGEFANFNIL